MFRAYYSEIAADDQSTARKHECAALTQVVDRLTAARNAPGDESRLVEALDGMEALWGVLMQDIASSGNALPLDLRASLFSIGRWLFSRASDLRAGRSVDLDSLIDVNVAIRNGLQGTT